MERLAKLTDYFLATGNLTSEKDAMTPALPLRSGLPHKTSQTLLACLFAQKGFKNSQTSALQSNAFSLNSSFQKEWLQPGGIGLECMGNSTGSEQAGGKQVLRGNGRGLGER